MLDFIFSSGNGVPDGAYHAEFVDVVTYEDPNGKYPAGVRWYWRITQGDQQGKEVSRITGRSPSPKNACGAIIASLLGATPKEGEALKVGACVGRKYACQVSKGKVESLVRMPS